MGKSYIGDFEFNASFDVNASKPFDTRFVVDNVSDLSNAISYPYVGLLVYVKADGKYYSYQETSTNVYEWVELQTSGGGGGDINTSNIYSYTSKYKSLGAVGDYARCVIALCKVTSTTNSSQYSFSDGTIVGARDNGFTPNYVAKVSMQDYYTNALSCTYNLQSNYENTSTTALSGDGFRACIFKYNNEYYGGLEFYQTQARNWHWYGVGNFTPFIVSYYNTNTSSAINSEINNSLTFSGPIRNKNSFYGDLNGNSTTANKLTPITLVASSQGNDLNTCLEGGGILANYSSMGYWKNAPTNFGYGCVVQLKPYNDLDMQFAWDINHNSTLATNNLWFRCKNNLGFQNDWKKILDDTNGVTLDTTQTITATKTFTNATWGQAIIVKRSDSNDSVIRYENSTGILGFIGVAAAKYPYWHNNTSSYALLHAGNYSSYAIPLSGTLSYTHTNEVNFRGGEQTTCYFNNRNAETDAISTTPASITYKFCNYTSSTSNSTLEAGTFKGNLTGNCSGSAGSVAWGNVTGKPTTFSPSSHSHYSLVTEGDNRNVNTTPDSYSNSFVFRGLKTNSYIGSPSTDSFSYVFGFRGWLNSTGGNSYELAFNNTGIYQRNGATTSWNAWKRILDGNCIYASGDVLYIKTT